MKPIYQIRTWDTDLQRFTPQTGCPTHAHGPGELKRAIRLLRAMMYDGRRYDNSVLVERVEETA